MRILADRASSRGEDQSADHDMSVHSQHPPVYHDFNWYLTQQYEARRKV
jgi:hypothetical protein